MSDRLLELLGWFRTLTPSILPLCGRVPNYTGMTDSRKYVNLSRHGTLRFMPTTMSVTTKPKEPSRVHGTNERTALPDFNLALCITTRALELFGGGHDAHGVGGDAAQSALHNEL